MPLPLSGLDAPLDEMDDHRPLPPEPAQGGPDPCPAPPPPAHALSALDLLELIETGQLDPKRLTADRRQDCVEALTLQGLSAPEVARVLSVTTRCVYADRAEVRRRNAMGPSIGLGDELMGEMRLLADATIQRLTRIGRDESRPVYARIYAQEAALRSFQRFIDTAQKLKYLEKGGQRLRYQGDGKIESLEEDRQRRITHYHRQGQSIPDHLMPPDKPGMGHMKQMKEARRGLPYLNAHPRTTVSDSPDNNPAFITPEASDSMDQVQSPCHP